MTHLTDKIAAVLDRHYGGWLDNGKPDECRCPCGHRPKLGESHSTHVATILAEELGLDHYLPILPPQPGQRVSRDIENYRAENTRDTP